MTDSNYSHRENDNENIVLHIRYSEPIEINGWRAETDTITFDSKEQLDRFIGGESAYDYLDNAIRKRDNEILLYAEFGDGTREIYKEETELETMEKLDIYNQAMELAGYHYDEINSYEGYLAYNYENATMPMVFRSEEEVREWLDGMVFDDPEISDKVEKIMHPERFEEQTESKYPQFEYVSAEENVAGWNLKETEKQNNYGYIDGLVRGFNVEFKHKETGRINYDSAVFVEKNLEDYYKNRIDRFGEDYSPFEVEERNGYEPTGRALFRGYYEVEWDYEERDEIVVDVDVEEYIRNNNFTMKPIEEINSHISFAENIQSDKERETDDMRVFYSYETKRIYEDLISDPNRKIAFGSEINGGFNGDSYFTYTSTTKMNDELKKITETTERQRDERAEFLEYAKKRGGIVEVAIESTDDYYDYETFNKGFRLVVIDENEGRLVPYDGKVFDTREEAKNEINNSDSLVRRDYDDLVHVTGDIMTKQFFEGRPAFYKIYPRNEGWDNVLSDWRKNDGYKVYDTEDSWVLYRDIKDLPYSMREYAQKYEDALENAGKNRYYYAGLDISGTADELVDEVKRGEFENIESLEKIVEILENENRKDDANFVKLYIDEINEAIEYDDYNISRMKIDFLSAKEGGYPNGAGGGLDDFELSNNGKDRLSMNISYESHNDSVIVSLQSFGEREDGTGAFSLSLDDFAKLSRREFDSKVGELLSMGMQYEEKENENERNQIMENEKQITSHGENDFSENDTKTVSQKVGRESFSPQTKDRQEKVNELRNKIKDGVEGVRNEEDYKAWLRTRSHNFMNKYSFNNIILVASQKPDASTVMGYEQWKEYGRQIKAGAKAINILVPMFYKEKESGNLCRDICAKLSSQMEKEKSNTASYRLPNTNLVFSVTKGSPQITLSLNGKEWTLKNRAELNVFLQKNVIDKTPRYFNPQNVFDVKDTYQPTFLSMKRGFVEKEVVKGKGENVPITNNEGKVLAKAKWSQDPNAPKGYDWVDKKEIGKGTWDMVSAPDGKPIETKKGEYLIENSNERKGRFKDNLEMKVVAKEPQNLKLLFDALKSVSEDKGVPVKIVSKESEEWQTSKEANGYYHKPIGIEQAQYPKGYVVIPSELVNDNIAHAVKTLFHECTHADLHENVQKLEKEMGQPVSRAMKETQAESVAFMACESYGIDSSDYSFKYLATWANDAELKDFTDSLKIIDREAKQLVDEVDAKLEEMGYSRDFKELPKDPLSNDAINKKAQDYVMQMNTLNAKVTNMLSDIDRVANEINSTQSPSNHDKAEIVLSMKDNVGKITNEISNQAKLIPTLTSAQTRVEQNDIIAKLDASFNRVSNLEKAYNGLEDSLKTISIRNKEGLHEQFLGNALSTLNKMSKDFSELKELSVVQKQYIAKSPYIKENLAPMLNENPKQFVIEAVKRANDAMSVASKTGMFVEVASCKATTEPAIFKGGELAHPKVADKIVCEGEKQIRGIKAKTDFFPNTDSALAIFSLTEKKNISCYVANVKMGDGTQLGLSDYLHKVCPQKKDLIEEFDKATRERGAKEKVIGLDFSHGGNEKNATDKEKVDSGVTMEVAIEKINERREENEKALSVAETKDVLEKGKNKKSMERGDN